MDLRAYRMGMVPDFTRTPPEYDPGKPYDEWKKIENEFHAGTKQCPRCNNWVLHPSDDTLVYKCQVCQIVLSVEEIKKIKERF
jgi:hypothetical protein